MENWSRDFAEGTTFCPQCGKSNKIENKFCDACGIFLDDFPFEDQYNEQQSVQGIPLQHKQSTTAIQYHRPTQVVSTKSIIGLVIGIISLICFPAFFFSSTTNIRIFILFLIITIIGSVISIKSIKEHNTIGTTGLIANTIGATIQAGIIWILIFI